MPPSTAMSRSSVQRRILVTGGCGFIGSTLVRHLLDQGHAVLNVDLLTYAGNPESLREVAQHPGYRFVCADICNAAQMQECFRRFRPDLVMHLAAESHVDRSIDDARDFIQTNVEGTRVLLDEALAYWRTLEGGRRQTFRFHHVSTDEVYGDLGPQDPPFREGDPYRPSSPYAASKAASDHLVRAWHRTHGLPVVISNCSNNYGPRQFPEKLIPLAILKAVKGENIPVYGRGDNVRDWLFVEDHAEALLRVALDGRPGETYHIGGNAEHTNLRVVQALCDLLEEARPRKPEGVARYGELITFVPDRPGHDRRYAMDIRKIGEELGWKPKTGFEEGLRRTVRWYLDNEPWWQSVLDGSYRLQRLGMAS